MPSPAVTAFNASNDPNKKLSDFTKPSLPGSSTPQPAPVSAPQPLSRDFNREQAVIQKLNINPSQLAMLDPKTLMERTYSKEELQNIPDYNTIQQYQQTTKPTNATMGILEQALRAKSDPGQQALGQSQGMENAGLQTEGVAGHSGLFTSLSARANEMRSNFDSFSTGIANTGRGMLAAYQPLAARYKDINDRFNKGMEYIQKLDEAAKAHEYSMDQINQQFENSKKMEAYKTQLAQGNVEDNQTGTTVITKNMNNTGETNFSDNCVLFARSENPSLPYGLFTRADKKNAIQQFGVQNNGGNSMDGIKVGDSILTSESAKGSVSGHAAIVSGIKKNPDGSTSLVLREANFTAGQITEGREISATDPKIYGYIAKGKQSNAQVVSPETQMQRGQNGETLQEGVSPGVFASEDEAKGGGIGGIGEPFDPQSNEDNIALAWANDSSAKPTAAQMKLYPDIAKRMNEITSQGLNNTEVTAKGILDGTIPPPSSTRPSPYNDKLNAAIKRVGGENADLTNMTQQYNAEKKLASTMGSSKMVSLAGAFGGVINSLDELDKIATELDQSPLKAFNKAKLFAMAETGDLLAGRYKTAYTMLQDELGVAIMQGNSPTDKSIGMAQSALDSAGSKDVMLAQTGEMRKLLNYRISVFKSMSPYASAFDNIGSQTQPSQTGIPIVNRKTGEKNTYNGPASDLAGSDWDPVK